MQGSKRNDISQRDDVFDSAGYHVPTSVSFINQLNNHEFPISMALLGSKSKLER